MLESLRHVASHSYLYAVIAKEKMHAALTEELGEGFSYFIDLENQKLEFSSDRGTVTGKAHLVASVAVDPTTYLWSYHQFFENHRSFSPVPAELERFALQHRLPDFSYAAHEYVAEGQDPQRAAHHVTHMLGQAAVEILGPAYSYYISTSGTAEGNWLISAVEGFDRDFLTVRLDDVLVKLPRLLSTLMEDGVELEWSLGGLARHLRGGLVSYPSTESERERLWKLSAPDGRFLWIETAQDDQMRLTDLRVHGVNEPEAAPPR